MNDTLDPAILEKACEAYRHPKRMLTNDSKTRHHDCMTAALEAVADDLRAEGAAKALSMVRADIRAEAMLRSGNPTCRSWHDADVFALAATYTPEWLEGLQAIVRADALEAGQS